jgi:hypothetical protein
MKTQIRRWLLTRKLRTLKRETDFVFHMRRETVLRESQLRREADAISAELLRIELSLQCHA